MSTLTVSAEELSRRVAAFDQAESLQRRHEGACRDCAASLAAVRSMRSALAKAEARTREAEYTLDAAMLLLKSR